jgi:hypothetical protein
MYAKLATNIRLYPLIFLLSQLLFIAGLISRSLSQLGSRRNPPDTCYLFDIDTLRFANASYKLSPIALFPHFSPNRGKIIPTKK